MHPNPIAQSGASEEIDVSFYRPEEDRISRYYNRCKAGWLYFSIITIICAGIILMLGILEKDEGYVYASVPIAVIGFISTIIVGIYTYRWRAQFR
jgi:hypothetical protein